MTLLFSSVTVIMTSLTSSVNLFAGGTFNSHLRVQVHSRLWARVVRLPGLPETEGFPGMWDVLKPGKSLANEE